jgi:hypothetical protein
MTASPKIPPLVLDPVAKDDSSEHKSQLDLALDYALAQVELFHDANKDCYAKRHANGYVWRLNSQAFKDFLSAECFKEFGKALRAQNLTEVINQLSAMARCDRPLRKVYCRIGQYDSHYYIDLCQPNNTLAVRWGDDGWQVIDSPPIDFVRTDTMQPLPVPQGAIGLEALWQICNVPQSHQLLFITWLIDAWRLDTPFPGLELLGEQGGVWLTQTVATCVQHQKRWRIYSSLPALTMWWHTRT